MKNMAITKEDLQAYMNSDEGKEVFSAIFKAEIERQGYRAPDEITGLVNKNKELLGKLKEAKEQKSDPLLTKLEKYAIYNEDDLENMLSTATATKGKDVETERMLKKLQRDLETTATQKAEFEKQAATLKERFYKAEKEKAISQALISAGIDDKAHDILSVYFDRFAKVEEDDDKLSIIADDGAQRLPLSDYIKQWSTTDKAKHYIKAPVNMGAGTVASGQKQSAKLSIEQIAQIPDRTQRYEAMKENGYIVK